METMEFHCSWDPMRGLRWGTVARRLHVGNPTLREEGRLFKGGGLTSTGLFKGGGLRSTTNARMTVGAFSTALRGWCTGSSGEGDCADSKCTWANACGYDEGMAPRWARGGVAK